MDNNETVESVETVSYQRLKIIGIKGGQEVVFDFVVMADENQGESLFSLLVGEIELSTLMMAELPAGQDIPPQLFGVPFVEDDETTRQMREMFAGDDEEE